MATKDVAVLVIYIKRLMDHKTLKIFMPALTKAIGEGKPHSTCTIVDTLCDVVLSRMPKRARLTKVLQRIKTNNVMGDRGENLITFSEGLMRDLRQSSWESMTMAEAGVLMWLTKLTLTNPHHVRLSKKVHTAWDLAESREEQFTIMTV